MRAPPGADLLRQTGYRRYFLGRTISSFGSAFGFLALTFAILGSGGGPAVLGIVMGAGAVPALLLMLVGGVAGDRLERRRILVATDLVMMLVQAAFAVLFAAGLTSVWVLAVLQMVRGAASAFFNPTSTGMLPSVVDRDRLQTANAFLGLAGNISSIVGPAVAGVVVTVSSPSVALGVDAASYAVSAMFLAGLPRSTGRVQAGMTVLDDVRAGWREFSSRPWVWQMVASFAIYQATVLPGILLVGPALAERSGLGAGGWSVVLTARAVGSLVAGLVLIGWRPARPLVASTAIMLLDVPFLLAIADGWPLAVQAVTGAVSSLAIVLADTVWESTLQRRIPDEAISRVSSYDWLGSLALNPVGNVMVGVAAAQVGGRPVLLVALAVTVLTHLLLLLSPAIRAREADVDPVSEASP